MRFNLRIALVAMAYVALAAAAFAAPGEWMLLALWSVSLLIVNYALLVAIVSHGRLRACAFGFALTAATYLACLHAAPESIPWQSIIRGANNDLAVAKLREQLVKIDQEMRGSTTNRRTPEELPQLIAKSDQLSSQLISLKKQADTPSPAIPALKAIGTMLAGLVGCGLGALAYRRGHTE